MSDPTKHRATFDVRARTLNELITAARVELNQYAPGNPPTEWRLNAFANNVDSDGSAHEPVRWYDATITAVWTTTDDQEDNTA